MEKGASSDTMVHCLARSSLSCCHLPLLAIFGIIILCKTSITVHYHQIIIIMKITITMIFPKESQTKSHGRCSHINVTHWHSTRLTGDKTKTNVTDCHDDYAYTVTDRDGAALIDSDQDNDEPFEESEDRLVVMINSLQSFKLSSCQKAVRLLLLIKLVKKTG